MRFGYDFNPWDGRGNYGRDTMIGLTLGAGVEYAVTNHVIARLDYRYSDFDGKTVISGDEPPSPAKIDLDSHDLFFGVAYKF